VYCILPLTLTGLTHANHEYVVFKASYSVVLIMSLIYKQITPFWPSPLFYRWSAHRAILAIPSTPNKLPYPAHAYRHP
jgi:hypothetical protein